VRTEGGAIVPNSFPEREPPTPVNGALAGRACDADREPLDGCRVLVSGPGGSASETQTDAQGYFSATGVQAGRYDLTITRSGYRKTRQEGVQVAAGLVGDCGTITLEKTNCGPIGIALLVLLAIAIVVALVAKGLLNRDRDRLPTDELRAGKAARGYRCRDSSGAVEEIVGSKSMYNVTVDVESGVIRAGGSGDYVVTFGGSPVPPGGETRLRPGDLVIRTRDGLELGRWHLER
jgi:hypothetical protein